MFNPAPVYQRDSINGVLERHVYKQRLRSGRDGPQPGDGILSQRNIGYNDVVIVGYVLFQQLADRIGGSEDDICIQIFQFIAVYGIICHLGGISEQFPECFRILFSCVFLISDDGQLFHYASC